MLELHTTIDIAAPPQQVWAVLMDFANYPHWNPFVRAIVGTPAVGEQLTVTLQPEGGRAMTIRPRVLAAAPYELRWRGQVLFSGIFDGEHRFVLEPNAAGTRFIHGERFSGVLVPLFRSMLEGSTKSAFEAMNRALKQRVEQRS